MIYYKIKDKIVLSKIPRDSYEVCSEEDAMKTQSIIYSITNMDPRKSRRSFSVTHPSMLFLEREDLSLLKNNYNEHDDMPNWLLEKIKSKQVTALNATYPNWQDVLEQKLPNRWRINIVGLGDVGGTLVAGLRLIGGDYISRVGIYDRDPNRIKRWFYEAGQILPPSSEVNNPEIYPLSEDEIFDCDIFVFCVSIGVPEIGKEPKDVRIAQFEGNSKILSYFAKLARTKNYKGIFAVVSDPVDLLCKVAFNESNKDISGNMDFKGLAPEQIRGYGLGVMHGRAGFYAKEKGASQYFTEGRSFGPHGEGVIIADSIKNYNRDISEYLTDKTKTANLEVRSFGFKPYIAPALSSGSLSFLYTAKRDWNYSATFIGGTFMGSRNRLLNSGIELETFDFPDELFHKLEDTYKYLNSLYT